MSDRTHLKALGLVWAVVAGIAVAGSSSDVAGYVLFGLAGIAYIAAFFADAGESA